MSKTIFFSVGEPSGDLHGANLISALKNANSDLEFTGFGGPKMQAAGCRLQFDLTQLAVMWILAVVVNIHKFFRLLKQADNYFRTERPDAVVLIDYPGFNWWIARRAKAHNIPVIYYGTPQLWAWAPWRVAKMRKFVDHVLCKLPFEEKWFQERDCNATFVGHPYFDELAERKIDEGLVASLRSPESTAQSSTLVTILPGSRNQEVVSNLPAMLRVAVAVKKRIPTTRFAIASFNMKQAIKARELLQDSGLDIEVRVNCTPELIEAADICLACSGSVSLELLYHAKPTVVYYQVSRWAYWIQDKVRIARYITLTNLLDADRISRKAGENHDPDAINAVRLPMPEYLVCEDRSAKIAARVIDWLESEELRQRKIEELKNLRDRFAHPGASQRAADYITGVLGLAKEDAAKSHSIARKSA